MNLENIETIGMSAFYGCKKLSQIDFGGSSFCTVESWCFANCSALNTVVITDNVISLGDNAFKLSGLLEISIGSGISEIKTNCFDSCGSLNKINFNGTITSIGPNAFSYCTNLSSTNLNWSALQSIGDNAFNNCESLTGDITLNKSCVYNIENSFLNCPLRIRKTDV